jgi:tRNA(Ile)-lysidine synthase
MDLLNQFIKNWNSRQFAPADKTILLAVSGGIDSMAMAQLFIQAGIPFAIGHCNFQLRGEEANLDTALVAHWANEHDIPFQKVYFETRERAEEWKKGIQETARILRYEWLDKVRLENGYYRIATAHHANDNMETLLMNLFKGTGIAGLHSIPQQTDTIIRPLLFAGKDDIVEYVKVNNVPYRDDASNASDYYLRNAVRHKLTPVIEELFPGAVQNVNNSIRRFAEAEILYKKAIDVVRKKLIQQRGKDWYVPVLKLQKQEPLNTICYELFTPFGFSTAQISHIIQLMSSESGRYIDSETHRIIHNRNFLIVTAKQTIETDLILVEGIPCSIITGQYSFHFSLQQKPKSIPQNPDNVYLDAKDLVFPLALRKWKTGDYFYPLGMGMKKKKLSKFFIDQKLPIHEKEQAWVLESGKRIAWIAGMRPDERFKVRDNTVQVLVIERKLV